MAAWEFDAIQYANVERNIAPGVCKDSRITAMYIDTVANTPLTVPYAMLPWDFVEESSMRQYGDVRDRMEHDRLVEAQPYNPPGHEQWHSDYPAQMGEPPQGLSLLAAAIVASRRATGTAGGDF